MGDQNGIPLYKNVIEDENASVYQTITPAHQTIPVQYEAYQTEDGAHLYYQHVNPEMHPGPENIHPHEYYPVMRTHNGPHKQLSKGNTPT